MKKTLAIVLSLIIVAVPLSFASGTATMSVRTSPKIATLKTEIELEFSFDEAVAVESEIIITLPSEMNIPPAIPAGLITVNQIPTEEVKIDTGLSEISFIIPSGVEDLEYLLISIPLACGIANPVSGGNYLAKAEIDEHSFQAEFVVESLLEEAPLVSISPDLVGKPVSATIQIPACKNLSIETGDTIKITFPPEFIFPEFPEINYLSVNGNSVPVVAVNENILSIVSGDELDTEKPVTITIEPEFGIVAPFWPGTFFLTVEVVGKLEETKTEPFQLRPLKSTVSVSFSPQPPENGWFSEPPEVELSSTADRELFYFIGNTTKTSYTEPFTVEEEGVSVVSFMGRIPDGGWEAIKRTTVQLDTSPPVVAELGNSAFTNQEEYEFEYLVTDVSPCTSGIAGVEGVEAVGKNRFKATVDLDPGKNEFVFFATDSCGRKVETTHTITLDVSPPPLDIFTPVRGGVICAKMIKIEGMTEPDATIKVSGNPATVDETGRFWAVSAPSEEGPINIEVVATDTAGNITKIIIPIIYITGTSIVMKVDSKNAKFAGVERTLSLAPFKEFETTFIPLEEISESLHYKLSPDENGENNWVLEDEKTDTKVFFFTGETKLFIHKEGSVFEIDLANSPKLKSENNIVCVPLEFIGKVFSLTPSEYADGSIVIRFCPR